MDDEWVLMESSLESSQSNSNNDYRPSLDFNRFSSMPAYAPEEDEAIVKDDSYISEQQQEREESVVSESEAEVDNIFNESPPVSDNEFTDLFEEQSNSIDITLGYNNTTAKQQVELHDNDERNNNKSLENNEPDMIIYLEQRPDESASFLSSSILNQQEQATRESLVDKHTIWKNSTLGSSVPYMSNHPSSPPPPSPPKAEHTNLSKYF